MKTFYQRVICCSLLLLIVSVCFSTGSVCVTFGELPAVCGSNSTWAVNTPNVSVSHDFVPSASPPFNIRYKLDSSIMCEYAYVTTTTCSRTQGPNCESCSYNSGTPASSIDTDFYVMNLDISKNQSSINYDLAVSGVLGEKIHTFILTECPEFVGNAYVINYTHPCGYGCCKQFDCYEGFELTEGADPNATYCCAADATWTGPVDLCVPDTTTTESAVTTTKDTATTETAVTTTTGGGTQLDAQRKKLEIALSVIGGLSILADFEFKEFIPLTAGFVICMSFWGAMIGVNAGFGTHSAFVWASVVGSLALLGAIIVIVRLILLLKRGKSKGNEQEKAADGEDVPMKDQ